MISPTAVRICTHQYAHFEFESSVRLVSVCFHAMMTSVNANANGYYVVEKTGLVSWRRHVETGSVYGQLLSQIISAGWKLLAVVRKRISFAPFQCLKCIILPRQARDKHRERHSKKDAFLQLQGYEHKENPKLKINRTVLAEELLQCTQHNAKCQPVIIGPTALVIRARTQAKPTTCESVDADRSLHVNVNVVDVMAASSTNRMTLIVCVANQMTVHGRLSTAFGSRILTAPPFTRTLTATALPGWVPRWMLYARCSMNASCDDDII